MPGRCFAFVLVAIGTFVLRRTRPDLKRTFRCPGVPVMPVLATLTALYSAFSRLKRFNSADSSVVVPGRAPPSTWAWRTHLRTVSAQPTPSSARHH
jgi:amino acid transporter